MPFSAFGLIPQNEDHDLIDSEVEVEEIAQAWGRNRTKSNAR